MRTSRNPTIIPAPRHQTIILIDALLASRSPRYRSEPLLRPAVVQRKTTNGYRAMWAATGEADIRTVVDTARLNGANPFGTILNTVGA